MFLSFGDFLIWGKAMSRSKYFTLNQMHLQCFRLTDMTPVENCLRRLSVVPLRLFESFMVTFYNNKTLAKTSLHVQSSTASTVCSCCSVLTQYGNTFQIWFHLIWSNIQLIKVHMKYEPLFTGHRKSSAVVFNSSLVPRRAFLALALIHFRWACRCCQFKSVRV